ncbi:MAG: glycine dehydrogenase, partial [Anaerolineales bacterium]
MKVTYHNLEKFQNRQIGPNEAERDEMLKEIGCQSLEQLMDETIPGKIRLSEPLKIPQAMQEYEFLELARRLARKNKIFKSFIGLGYYDTITPSVILRNIFENPGWYTQYTPYQAEIAQGRLEALLNFQTMVSDLTGMEIANASLLDEATAAAEAMTMLFRLRSRDKVAAEANIFFVSETCFPQTIDVLRTRAEPMGIELEMGDHTQFEFGEKTFGAIVQYPAEDGTIYDYRQFITKAHEQDILVVVAADLLSLVLLTPPGEMGADVVVGNSQRFGVPMGFGGPHAAYFTTRDDYKRHIPGRIIGVSIDRNENIGYRMALQTREQHIRREKATSNICTAQALLSIMAGMYAVYHGPEGLKAIAGRIHALTRILEENLLLSGFPQENKYYFDTLKIRIKSGQLEVIRRLALAAEMNFRYIDHEHIGISCDEHTSPEDIQAIVAIFAQAADKELTTVAFEKYDR